MELPTSLTTPPQTDRRSDSRASTRSLTTTSAPDTRRFTRDQQPPRFQPDRRPPRPQQALQATTPAENAPQQGLLNVARPPLTTPSVKNDIDKKMEELTKQMDTLKIAHLDGQQQSYAQGVCYRCGCPDHYSNACTADKTKVLPTWRGFLVHCNAVRNNVAEFKALRIDYTDFDEMNPTLNDSYVLQLCYAPTESVEELLEDDEKDFQIPL